MNVEEKELVTNASQQRNWRGIVIALLVIIIVCALIVTAVIIATPSDDSNTMGEKFSFEDFMETYNANPVYKPRSFSVSWIEGKNVFLYKNDYGEIRLFNCTSNTSELLVENSTFRDLDPVVTQISEDGKHLLLKYIVEKVFRHSRLSEYYTYDLTNQNSQRVLPPPKHRNETLQYAAFAPVGDAMVFVQNNNVFYKKHINATAEALTNNGKKNKIYNGIPDWVYEEEVFSMDHAIWWSKGATYLIYATFNDTSVPIFEFPYYGDMESSYTSHDRIAYPKAGYPNPTFTLNIVHLASKSKATLSPPVELANKDYLFTSVVWRSDDEVLITWMNRIQNRAILTLCNADGGRCKLSQDIKSTSGWLDIYQPIFMPDGTHYFLITPQREGSHGTYKHIAMVEIRNGPLNDRKVFLTYGRWEVANIEGYDPVNRTLYFTSSMRDARQKHLYSVSVDTKEIICETCTFDPINCLYNTVSMASTSDYYILRCEGPGVPIYSLMGKDGMEVDRMENNTDFKNMIAKKAMPQTIYEQVELSDGTKLWAKLLLPPQLKLEEILKYPLILYVYGGPGTQVVRMKYSIDWETYLVTSRDVIYAFVDARGTAGRGDDFLHAVYRNLGGQEVDDTVEAANHFAKLHYVDADKMALWGSSYGGYLTASVIGREKKPFQCGISVAPVTDWMYYDSIYTERFMRLPTSSDNLFGYRRGNVSQYANNFRDASFMLIHGTGDDNVHFQHSALLVKALTEADVYFRFQMYTDKEHSLMGGNVRRHMHETMEDFLVECFEGYSEKFGRRPSSGDDEDE